jgi:hypothetical protein
VRLVIRVLGLGLLDVDISTDADAEGCELAGGTLGSDWIAPGRTDCFMGFTNGLEDGE